MNSIVPIVPRGNGNIEHSPNPCIAYDFVINNWTPEEYDSLCQHLPNWATKYIIGKEVGESGTPHLQCYIRLKKKKRYSELQQEIPGMKRASFRPCRNELALIAYCKEDGDFVSFGFPKPISIITKLYDWQQKIVDLYNGKIDDRKIFWFWEEHGNIGKSAFVKYMVVKYKALFCDGGKKADIVNLVFNNNMDECRCIIWDIPRANGGFISYTTLESIKNGLVCNTKYETGVKIFNSPHVFVFANAPPADESQMSADRWVVTQL